MNVIIIIHEYSYFQKYQKYLYFILGYMVRDVIRYTL